MAILKIYEYKNCSTCKKALKFLDAKRIEYKKIAIVDNPPTQTEFKKMTQSYGGEIKKLFNTSGVMYREMNIKDKIKTMKPAEAFKLLAKNGKLVKRPFLIGGDIARVGFKEEEWKALF